MGEEGIGQSGRGKGDMLWLSWPPPSSTPTRAFLWLDMDYRVGSGVVSFLPSREAQRRARVPASRLRKKPALPCGRGASHQVERMGRGRDDSAEWAVEKGNLGLESVGMF